MKTFLCLPPDGTVLNRRLCRYRGDNPRIQIFACLLSAQLTAPANHRWFTAQSGSLPTILPTAKTQKELRVAILSTRQRHGLKLYMRNPSSYTPLLESYWKPGGARSLTLSNDMDFNRAQISKFSTRDAQVSNTAGLPSQISIERPEVKG